MAVYLEGQLQIDIIAGYRILSTQNEGGLARLPVRHPLGALDGGQCLFREIFRYYWLPLNATSYHLAGLELGWIRFLVTDTLMADSDLI